jgi:hypothetical protein
MRSPHRFLEPIHNVKQLVPKHLTGKKPDLLIFIPGYFEERLPQPQTNQRFARPTGRRRLCGGPIKQAIREANGGAYRDRTDDLMLAKQPLSQLS